MVDIAYVEGAGDRLLSCWDVTVNFPGLSEGPGRTDGILKLIGDLGTIGEFGALSMDDEALDGPASERRDGIGDASPTAALLGARE